ncbi:hypothetical protein JCM3766R1_006214 [Sporobolomyces carnicolor]
MIAFQALRVPLQLVVLLLVVAQLARAAHPNTHSIRTPSHLLANRISKFPRSLIEGPRTGDRPVNTTLTIGTRSKDAEVATRPSTVIPTAAQACFPLRSSGFKNGSVPAVSRSDWWCRDEELYGFLGKRILLSSALGRVPLTRTTTGFSYPLEIADCSDPSNQYAKIRKDLAKMKHDFGATFVRPYGVECREVSVWLNLVRACIELELGLIAQVCKICGARVNERAIYELFENSAYAQIAPYVVYSASFGSEPIGDWVDGDDFVKDLASFRTKMKAFGVPVGISEDWDRPGRMREGSAVTGIGLEVLKETQVAQLHVMPYYHPDQVPTIEGAWSYVQQEVKWSRKTLKQPAMITETMWSSQQGGVHSRGSHDEESTLENFKRYWDTFAKNCKFFKAQQTGWFVHTFDDSIEPYFGMLDSNGKTKITGWKPPRC